MKSWIVAVVIVLSATTVWAQTSPDNSRVPPLTSVRDSAGIVWTLASGTGDRDVLRNGLNTPVDGQASVLMIWKGVIYVLGANSWWALTGNTWNVVPDPSVAVVVATPVVPSGIEVLVLPAGTDPEAAPITGGTRVTAISATTTNCNQATATATPTPVVNPTTVMFDDPFHKGMTCRALLPVGLPVGSNYRVAARFTTATGTTCTDDKGANVTPCVSTRTVVAVPFAIAASATRPVAPTGAAFRN